MRVLIAGSNGMIGSAVTRGLIEGGRTVVRLVRREPGPGEVGWDPDAGRLDAEGIEGFDAVIHLASMPWPFRWTEQAKQKMRANRLATNSLLATALAACVRKPGVFICASGMGYYPSSGDAILTEDSPAGTGFLAALQRDGEAAVQPAAAAGIRVVTLRIPMVLGGAALQRVGFQAGGGQQWLSWVALEEMVSIIKFTLTQPALSGPVNAASPNPLRWVDFAARSASAMDQKPGCAVPAFLVRLAFGEMGAEFMLASRRLHPARLLAAGYRFQYPDLEAAIRHERSRVEPLPALQTARE